MEFQATSVEPSTRGESGEETATETFFPLGDHQQNLPSRFQPVHPLRAARFVRVDASWAAMAKGVGIALEDHRPSRVEHQRQTAQPTYESPDQRVVNNRLVSR